ncbi:hydrogenase large subunit [Desulfolithobacter sp.]
MGDVYKVPVGPVHIALEEPVYFKVHLHGETVESVDILSGFVHRGMEALVLRRNFLQNMIITERTCSLCSNNHPFTYIMAVEKIAGVRIPPRAEFLRVIADEVKRAASHLFNVSMQAHLIGFHSLMTQTMETREVLQDIKETIWGNRMDLSANTIGGVKYDLDGEQIRYLTRKLNSLKKPLRELFAIFRDHKIVRARTEGVGVLPREDALRLGVVGPTARGSGVNNDIRAIYPYAAYDNLEWDVVLQEEGDVRARTLVRLEEVFQAIRLVEQCLRNLPDGPVTTPGLPRIPAGEAVARSEAPRGELFYYVRSNGSSRPERMRWRVPTYMHWEALKVMIPGNKIADVALIFNSIDPCISCTER